MKTRSNKSYDITKTQKRGTKSTSQRQRRTAKNLQGDPNYQPFYQLRSAKSRARGTSSSTTFKPTIIKVKKAVKRPTMQYDMARFERCKTIKFKRTSSRRRWNYGKLVAAQAEAHRAAFQEAGVTQAPPPTWSYVRALAEKAATRAVHRTAFQEAGVERAPPPTWSYRRIAATKIASRKAHRAAFEAFGVDRTPPPTWSYKRAAARNDRRSSLQAVPELTSTGTYQAYESMRRNTRESSSQTSESSSETSESSGFASWSGPCNPVLLTCSHQIYGTSGIFRVSDYEPSESSSETSESSSETSESSSESPESSGFVSWSGLCNPALTCSYQNGTSGIIRESGYEPSDYSSL